MGEAIGAGFEASFKLKRAIRRLGKGRGRMKIGSNRMAYGLFFVDSS